MLRLTLTLVVFTSLSVLADDGGVLVEEEVAPAPVAEAPEPELEPELEAEAVAEAEEEEDEGPGEEAFAESVSDEGGDGGLLYSADVSDEVLLENWVNDVPALGSISVGVTEAGRLINGVQVPAGEAWVVVAPDRAYGTQETIDFVTAAADAVRAQFADAPPLRINHIGLKNGGYLRPHQSHQAGRDVDLGFYYPPGVEPSRLPRHRFDVMDLPTNWALVKALLVTGDVQFILVDQRVQKKLYDYALREEKEDKAWLDRVFHAGVASLVRHARGHRDHFHVRYFAGRSQELGRRIAPLLAKQPEQNLVIHRVKSGDTLGALALRYNSGVKLIQKANGMSNTMLRVGRTLQIPLRGPCTKCPVPPQQVVPPRCLPPEAPHES